MSTQDFVEEFKVDGAFQDREIPGEAKAASSVQRLISAAQATIAQAENGLEMTTAVAVSLSEDETAIQQLEASVFQLLDDLAIVKSRVELLEGYHRRLRAGNPIVGLVKDYEDKSAKIAEERRQKTKRRRFADDELYRGFRESIWEALNPDDPCPPMNDFLDREDGDEEDDEIQMGAVTQTYRCPITMTLLENAVTCSHCKHSYSRAAVVSYITDALKSNKRNVERADKLLVRCPVAGCAYEHLSLADLQTDKAIQARADKFAKKQVGIQTQINDSDEEVI